LGNPDEIYWSKEAFDDEEAAMEHYNHLRPIIMELIIRLQKKFELAVVYQWMSDNEMTPKNSAE
jgi:hypothetical protein